MKKFLSLVLCIVMLVTFAVALNIGASAYNAGDIILDESQIDTPAEITSNLKDKAGDTVLSWNSTTGRLNVKAPKQGAIEIGSFAPTVADAFTLTGDIYVIGTGGGSNTQSRVGMGVFSDYGGNATGWTNGFYMQFMASNNFGNSDKAALYVENSSKLGSQVAVYNAPTYTKGMQIGTGAELKAKAVSFKLVVDPSSSTPFAAYIDNVLVATISTEITEAIAVGKCFLFVRNCEFEVDNLKITYDKKTQTGDFTQPTTAPTTATSALTLPPETDTVYYPNGTIILNEEMFKNNIAENFVAANTTDVTKYAFSWNETNGKLKMSANGVNLVTNIAKVPAGLDNYTITGKFVMTENNYGNKAIMGLGINSAGAWSRSTYIDAQIFTDGNPVKVYVDSFNLDGSSAAAGRGHIVMDDPYEIGVTEYTFKIVVEPDVVTYYCNDTFIAIANKADLPYPANVPTIILRDKCTIEIDDLMVYSGSGDPDPTKVIGQVAPIPAPEATTSASTDETSETTPSATTTSQTTTAAEGTTAADTTTTAAKKSGCKSSIGIGMIAIVGAVCTTGAVCRRKRK